jgi:hypothetical protein
VSPDTGEHDATGHVHPHIPRIGSAVLVHGFSRGPQHLRVLSSTLTRRGVATVRPSLSAWDWLHGINNSRYLTSVAERISRGLPAGPVVVVGHSAGAAAGAWIAAELVSRSVPVRRLVMVDGVENPAQFVRRSWPRLGSVDIADVCGVPSRCNRQGELAHWLARQDREVRLVTIEGGGHGDIEVVPSAVYSWACGDTSTEETRRRVLDTVVDLAVDALTQDQ